MPTVLRSALNTTDEVSRAEAYDRAEETWEPVYLSKEAEEGPLAFREKRTPVRQGI